MKFIKLLIIPAVLLVGCDSQKDQQGSDDIAGTYVMEKTYEVRHEATGAPVGMATLRDTIIITKLSDGYEVKNRKWRKNEFDQEGWVKQVRDALPTYKAKFEHATLTMYPEASEKFRPFEIKENVLVRGNSDTKYQKL